MGGRQFHSISFCLYLVALKVYRASKVWGRKRKSSCLVLQLQPATVSRPVTSSCVWSWTISVNVNEGTQDSDSWTQYSSLVTSGVPRAGRGGFGVFKPPPKSRRPSKMVLNSTLLCKLLKIAEFRTPTPQDIRKKGSKILKLPRFAIVLHQQWQINWLPS